MNDWQRDPFPLLPEWMLAPLAVVCVVMLTIHVVRWLLRRWRRR
jgi:hypothetical protein